MFVLLKSTLLLVAAALLLTVLCICDAQDSDSKDVSRGLLIEAKDFDVEGLFDESKNQHTGAGDPKAKDSKKKDPKAKDSKEKGAKDKDSSSSHQEQQQEEGSEERSRFLTRKEACDFLGIGEMFENPEHHMFLLQDYMVMEQTDYWDIRCTEKVSNDTDAVKPGYCV